MKHFLILLLISVLSTQAQFLSNGRGGGGTPLAASIYYVSVNGNDTTAVAGDATKAYAKLSAAVSNAVNNSVIYVMPDTQVVTPYLVREPDIDSLATAGTVNFINKTNITIRGPGAILYGAGQGNLMIIKDSDNITIDGLTFHGNYPTTNATCIVTNYGHVFLSGGMDNILFKGCVFKSFGQFGICHTDNINESANDNPNRISIDGCVFVNGGATNAVGYINRGGALGVRARFLSVVNSSYDNIINGIVAYNQDSAGRTTATNTTIKITGNTFNKVWNSVVITAILDYSLLYTNDQTVIFTGNVITDLGLKYPNNLVAPLPICMNLSATRRAIVTGNSIAGNYRATALHIYSEIPSSSIIFEGNSVKNSEYGLRVTPATSSKLTSECIVNNNSFENIGLEAIYLSGKNSSISGNTFSSICTNLAGVGPIVGQISIIGDVPGYPSTNIVVRGNSFRDSDTGSPGNSILFTADTNCFNINFEDNVTIGRLSAVTNNYIQHFGSGSVRHKYKFTTTANIASQTHLFPLTNGYSGIFIAKAIGNGVVTGTNWNHTSFRGASMQHYGGVVNINTTGTQLTPWLATTLTGHALAGAALDISSTGGSVTPRLTSQTGGGTINWEVEVEYSMLR